MGYELDYRSREAREDAAEDEAERTLPQRAAAHQESIECNADRFGEWFSTYWTSGTNVTFSTAPRDESAFDAFASTLTPDELLMYALQHALAYPIKAAKCMDLLRARYVRESMVADGWHESFAS